MKKWLKENAWLIIYCLPLVFYVLAMILMSWFITAEPFEPSDELAEQMLSGILNI
jgi:hypothetical protein